MRMECIFIFLMIMCVFNIMNQTMLSFVFGILALLLLVFSIIISIYIESFAKREAQVETYKLLKIGDAWYKEHAPWKRLVMYEDENGDVDTLLCNESEFEIKEGNDETLTIKMSTPVYPKWMERFKMLPSFGAPSFRIIITVPNEDNQNATEGDS